MSPRKKADRFCDLLFSSLFSPPALDRDTLLRVKRGTGENCGAIRDESRKARSKLMFKFSRGSQEKRPFSNGLFSIQSEGLACNLTAGEYVIAEGVWHHAQRVFLLRIDSIHHSVMIPYRNKLRITYTPLAWFVKLYFYTMKPKNPECESVQDFYFLPLHSSLFTNSACTEF